ncbi:MAG: arginine--tRNA ligase, partial [Clostridia bacterium]|nr:arginine--tRNA ligase [Clostridia bacterium]
MDFKAVLTDALASASGLEAQDIGPMIETPANPELGDLALPCFKLAKPFRKAPALIASELKEKLGYVEGFSRIEAVGGYLNFFTDKS